MHLINNRNERNTLTSGNDVLEIDATLSESIDASVSISKHRKESGVTIGDHAQSNPIQWQVEGRISFIGRSVNQTGDPIVVGQDKYSKLLRFIGFDMNGNCLVPKLLSISSGSNILTNMMPISLKTNIDNRRCIDFSITFEKFEYSKISGAISNTKLDTKNASSELKKKVPANENSGNVSTKNVKQSSTLFILTDFGKDPKTAIDANKQLGIGKPNYVLQSSRN